MKNDMIYRALEYVDETYLEAAADAIQSRTKPRLIRRWALTAACFLLIITVGLLPLIPRLAEEPPTPDKELVLSATDIAAIFDNQYDDIATTSYQKIYAPNISALSLSPPPDTEYVNLYEHTGSEKAPDLESYTDFTDTVMTKMAKSLNIPVPSYEIRQEENGYTTFIEQPFIYFLSTSHYPTYNTASFSGFTSSRVSLDGKLISANQQQSDEQIIASLSTVRQTLFTLFDISFTDAYVVREYGIYNTHGVECLRVYFYNASEHPLNATAKDTPYSDYLELTFRNYRQNTASDDILYNVLVRYIDFHAPAESQYMNIGQKKLLSLEEAEALLKKGYTFGNHICALCMASQTPIDFSDYDYVSLEYACNLNINAESNLCFPFYTFYKDIGKIKNGNRIYAKTYVPAVNIQGLDEYFKAQESNHPKTSDIHSDVR